MYIKLQDKIDSKYPFIYHFCLPVAPVYVEKNLLSYSQFVGTYDKKTSYNIVV
jgi:hypothetical protein